MSDKSEGTRADSPSELSGAEDAQSTHADSLTSDGDGAAGLPELLSNTLVAFNHRLSATSPEKEKKRDAWDVAGLIAGWAAALIIPIMLGVIGYFLNLTLKNRESQTKMVELAINLLKVDPKASDEDKALRNWAMDVIDKYSEVKLPSEVRRNLESTPLEVPLEALEGSATTAAAKALNRLKNRYLLPNESDIDKTVSLRAMLAPGDDEDRFDDSKAAIITGFVIDVKMGGRSTANFQATDPNKRDTHIYLAESKDAPLNQRVIAVVTPRLRVQMNKKGIDWTTNALRDPKSGIKGKWIEVTGWLLFELFHEKSAENTNPEHPQNWRATAWEIHPVTGIKVLAVEPATPPK